jgi:hypothetical protein
LDTIDEEFPYNKLSVPFWQICLHVKIIQTALKTDSKHLFSAKYNNWLRPGHEWNGIPNIVTQ